MEITTMASAADHACRGVALIVDSTPGIRELCRKHLEPEGFRVLVTENDRKAINAIRRILPDILLIDITAPDRSNFQAIEEMKADPVTSDIPILVLSVRNGSTSVEKALRMGADEFLKKPFDADELVARVNKVIRLNQTRQEFLKASEELIRSQLNITLALKEWERESMNFKKQCEAIIINFLAEAGETSSGDKTKTRSEQARQLINRITKLHLTQKSEYYFLH
jgi:DNA-binding response OmpR family regulator